jgi:hypothetical protein
VVATEEAKDYEVAAYASRVVGRDGVGDLNAVTSGILGEVQVGQ